MEDRGQNVDLPSVVIYEILSRLPVKSLCSFNCVSKPWRSLISDPDFVTNYSKLAIENDDVFLRRRRLLFTLFGTEHYVELYSLDLDQFLNENQNVDVATPTELEFFRSQTWDPFVYYSGYGLFLSKVICCPCNITVRLNDPVTKKSKTLPEPPIWRLPKEPSIPCQYGLGFDYSTNEHKVIQMQKYDDGTVLSVYTLQTESWRQIDNLFPYKPLLDDGILVNGGVHWLVKKIADESLVIMSFLLAKEEVRETALPPDTTDPDSIGLGAFRKWLCITSESLELPSNEFWVMKEYGVRESWTKMQVNKPYFQLSHSGFWTESHDLMVFDRSSLVMYNFHDGTFWNLLLSIGDTSRTLGKVSFGRVGIYLESIPSLTYQE